MSYIDDIKCPYCGSIHTSIYNDDEIDFSPDGTGHYNVDVGCFDCGQSFRKYYNFIYEIVAENEN